MSLIILRLILIIVLKTILSKLRKVVSNTLLLLNCTAYFQLHKKHIECVEAE